MRRKEVKAIVDRQITGVTTKAEKIRAGIAAVAESPGVAAARNIDKMVANFMQAFNDGSMLEALQGIDLASWKEQALAGVGRIGPGMERKRAVIEAFHAALQDYQMRYTAEIDRMPSTSLEDSRARMNRNFDEMSQFRFRR